MENKLIHSLSISIVNRINFYVHKEGLALQKMILGAEVLIINVSKLSMIFILAALLNLIPEMILTLIGFNVIRRYASGLHASNSTTCTLVSIVLFIGIPYMIQDIVIPTYAVFLTFVMALISVYFYAPADTESRPIIGKEKRARLKRKALTITIVSMIFTLLIRNNEVQKLLSLGVMYETIAIQPLLYKFLKKGANNYEKYE